MPNGFMQKLGNALVESRMRQARNYVDNYRMLADDTTRARLDTIAAERRSRGR